MSDIAIRVDKLAKRYRIGELQKYKALRDVLTNLLFSPFHAVKGILHKIQPIENEAPENIFWALKDVSFEVKRGEVMGIIGRNGAGKSTLLKILSRITEPTDGYAEIHGRLGSLLEVGTGFHPELTGRENIYLNGAILGMHRAEIIRKFDEIVAFSEIEKFLDTPVKHFSSGMYMRLAFAVAAHMETEVLLVDEVLAVGDAEFQKKCLGKMGEVAKQGRTVLFVSHNMNAVQLLCGQCIWIYQGQIVDTGKPDEIITQYLKKDTTDTMWISSSGKSRVSNPYFNPLKICIVDHKLNILTRDIGADEEFGVLIEGSVEVINIALTMGFAIYSSSGELLFWSLQTDVSQEKWPQVKKGLNKLVMWVPCHFLNEGDYRFELILSLHSSECLSEPGLNAPIINVSIRGGLSESPYWTAKRPGFLAPVLTFSTISD